MGAFRNLPARQGNGTSQGEGTAWMKAWFVWGVANPLESKMHSHDGLRELEKGGAQMRGGA